MVEPGTSRRQIARTLNVAYSTGLLSKDTLSNRLDDLFTAPVIDPWRLIGDLNLRAGGRDWRGGVMRLLGKARRALRLGTQEHVEEPPRLLGLDWSGKERELLVGRHHECDVVLGGAGVSRRHARLVFRDGSWVLQDLGSTNGTTVNGARIGRCEIWPGDLLVLGDERLTVD